MKKLILSAAFAIAFASPAFAQSYNPGDGTGNVIDQPGLERGAPAFGPSGTGLASSPEANSYAYAPRSTHRVRVQTAPAQQSQQD